MVFGIDPPPPRPSRTPLQWLRRQFFTGVVVGAPIGITIWLIWSFVSFVDNRIKPLIPAGWNPETYLKFALPGLGIVVAVAGITALGALTANLAGKSLLSFGESLLMHVPVVRQVYSSLKQVFETFASGDASAFKEVVLLEYPRKGAWSLGFVTNRQVRGGIESAKPGVVAVFIPMTPNPAGGFLVFVAPEEVVRIEMTVDEAFKLLASAGILSAHSDLAKPSEGIHVAAPASNRPSPGG